MVTTPKSPEHKEPVHHEPVHHKEPEAKVVLKPGDEGYDPAKDPNRIVTVQEEQLARSEEMQKVGTTAWMYEHSPQPQPETERKTVPGVGPLAHDEGERHGRR